MHMGLLINLSHDVSYSTLYRSMLSDTHARLRLRAKQG